MIDYCNASCFDLKLRYGELCHICRALVDDGLKERKAIENKLASAECSNCLDSGLRYLECCQFCRQKADKSEKAKRKPIPLHTPHGVLTKEAPLEMPSIPTVMDKEEFEQQVMKICNTHRKLNDSQERWRGVQSAGFPDVDASRVLTEVYHKNAEHYLKERNALMDELYKAMTGEA